MQHSNLADDSDSWLSTAAAASSAPNSNLNRDLFNDLVQIVPLVQSLIDSKATRSSFTRRGSIIYTKTPARESLFKK
ncbi:hop-interacting protein thi110, partial [Trifolium pratense]